MERKSSIAGSGEVEKKIAEAEDCSNDFARVLDELPPEVLKLWEKLKLRRSLKIHRKG